jgi:hypothetical protein
MGSFHYDSPARLTPRLTQCAAWRGFPYLQNKTESKLSDVEKQTVWYSKPRFRLLAFTTGGLYP